MAGPHQGQPVVEEGEPLETARAAMILAHGRGASALDIMTIAAEVMFPGVAYLAPQAAGSAWYPNPFTAPLEANEPYLSSALEVLSTLLTRVRATVPTERIVLLVGPDNIPRDYPGDFQRTPVFLGCSDVDPYIRKERVSMTAEVFQRMGAEVTARLYPGMGHTSNADEIDMVRSIVKAVAA